MRPIIAFTGSNLDRADAVRSSPERLAELRARGGRLLRTTGVDPLLEDGALVWDDLTGAEGELVFLGLDPEGRGCFAAVPESASAAPAGFNLWEALVGVPAADVAIYGTARALIGWHARHRFCAVCGAPTVPAKGGWQRDCQGCGAAHFPRTDPVVIMAVEHADASGRRLLLGRQPRFPAGRYSALAGFIEPGESIEEAVAREIYEEAGVRVRDVRYVASQPWPFPSSLMIAARAFADDPTLTIDRTELEDARWFTREEVAEAMAARARGESGRAFNAPAQTAVAWHLLSDWLGE